MRSVVDRNVVMRRMTVQRSGGSVNCCGFEVVKLVATSDTAFFFFFFAGAMQCVETVSGKRESHSLSLYPLLK